MKQRKVFLGPRNNHMKEQLQDASLEYLKMNKGDQFYYLLPNRELLNAYRNHFIDKLDATFELNFFTFDDIVTRMMADAAGQIAGDTIKRIIMRTVLKRLKNQSKLNYYRDFTEYNGFVETCIYIIGRIKRSLVTPQDYLLKCGDDPYYKEMGLIYEQYENELREKDYQDKDSLYLESIDLLKHHKGFLNTLDFMIIDEFYDFRPIELELLSLLKDSDMDIYINIPYETKAQNIRLEETIEALENLGFEIERVTKEERNEFEALGNILFDRNDARVHGNIELTKAASLALEIKKIFKEIKNTHHYEAIDLKDNCICILNRAYCNMIFKVAKEEKLPVSMDNTIPLKMLPLTKEMITLIEFNLHSGRKEKLLHRLKSGYLSVCEDHMKDPLAYVLRKSKFKDMDDLYNRITHGISMDIPEMHREDLIAMMHLLKKEEGVLEGNHTLKDFNVKLLGLLEEYNVEENILNRYGINKNFQVLQRDLANLKTIKAILTDMEATTFMEEEIDLEEYLMILLDCFEEEKVIETKGNPNGIQIVTIDNARGIPYRRVFIPGLTQGTYPNLVRNTFFFSADNHDVLKAIGIDVKNDRNRLDNEILKFVSFVSSCKEKLYLSCNLDSEGDVPPLYSIFLDEILHKLKGEKEEEKVKVTSIGLDFLFDNEIKTITSEREFSLKIFNDYYKGKVDFLQLQYHNGIYREKMKQIGLQFESIMKRKAQEFNSYTGLLKTHFSKEYIDNEFKNQTFSVSYLEQYAICPYAFLLKNIFNINALEREMQDYNPMDYGTIYHEVLRRYYERFKDAFKNIEGFNVSNTVDFLKEILLSEASQLGYKINSNKERLLIEDMYHKLKNFIEFDMERLKKNKEIKPWRFEEWFNMEFEIHGQPVEIRGIIDRIDRTNDDQYLIIDYKTSAYGKRTIKDIENKVSLQLPIYILSQKDKKVMGGFYGIIKKPEFHTGMGLLGESKLINSRQSGAMDLETWDKVLSDTRCTIEEIFRSISEGDFSVNPKECSPYCIYKDICRYDKVQEVEE